VPTSTLDQLLSLDRLSTDDPLAAFEFAHPLPAWAWALLVPTCLAFAVMTYVRLSGPRGPRLVLGVLRGVLVLFLALLLSGPRMAKQTESVERDWVLFLVDRSLSMGVADAPDASGPSGPIGGSGVTGEAGPVTRDAQLKHVLESFGPDLQTLGENRNVAAFGFGNTAYDITPAFMAMPPVLPAIGGRATRLGQAIDQTLADFAGRPVSGIVVFSDGRASESLVSAGRIGALAARSIPVFAVPLGSTVAVPDLAIERIDVPAVAFVNDLVPVSVSVSSSGGPAEASAVGPGSGTIELFDEETGEVLQSRALSDPDERAPNAPDAAPGTYKFTFPAKSAVAGAVRWGVRLRSDVADLSLTNNLAPVRVEFASQRIRVLYIDGYPRWEYRYLKNTLMREEETLRSSVLILSSDRRFVREGSDPIDAAPRTLADWSEFDAVILGDVRPEVFSDSQISQLRSLVAERGAGLIWLGGPAAVPLSWKGHSFADLLPFNPGMTGESGIEAGKAWLDPVVARPAPAAQRYGVLQLGDSETNTWPGWLSDGSLKWTLLRFAQRFDVSSLKPTTEVLAESMMVAGNGERAGGGATSPLVMTMRYGAGRVVYVATDEIWRLRYGRGEILPERFWIPLVRLAARESLGRTGKSASIELSPTTAVAGQPVRVTLKLLDQSLLDAAPDMLRVRVSRAVGDGEVARAGEAPVELTLMREADGSVDAFREAASVATFAATFTPSDEGRFVVDSIEAVLAGAGATASLEVVLADDELRVPQTNHPLLARLATETGGAVVMPDQIGRLTELLPNREVRILGVPEVETLWDTPLAWLIFIVLICLELVGRRLVRLA